MSTTAKPENTAKETKPVKKKQPTKIGQTFQFLNFFLSLAIIVALGVVGFSGWQKLKQQDSLIHAQQQKLEQALAAQQKTSNLVSEQIAASSRNQTNELNTLKETLAAFLKQNKHARRDWLITEAEYLVKLANHRLILAHDIPTSILALQAADSRLQEVGNPKFIPLRKAIALNIQQLNAVPKIDIVGISAQLDALQLQTESLPFKTPDPQTIKQRNSEASTLSKINSWQQLPAAIWQDLLKLFRIQKHNEAIKPLLMPEQRFFLIQNLKLQLEQARIALLNNQPVIFKDRLEQTQSWITNYFDKQHAITIAVVDSLKKLSTTNITLTLPDISESLTSLQLLQEKNIPTKTKQKTRKKISPRIKIKPLPKNKALEEHIQPAPQKKLDSRKSEEPATKI